MGPNDPFTQFTRDPRPTKSTGSIVRRRAPSPVWIGGGLGVVLGALILAIGLPRASVIVLFALIGAALGHFVFGRAHVAT